MKRQVLLILFSLSWGVGVYAQNNTPQDSVQLQEIVVKGAKIVNKVDGKLIFPGDEVKRASTSGYDFLKRLALPGIKVDDVSETITSNELLGQVQVRINDVVATQADLQSLQPQSVERIEYIEHPGAKYGEGIGFVVNIIVKRPTTGYVAGASGTWLPKADLAKWSVYTKNNFGKNELSINYSGSYRHLNGSSSSETVNYLMSNNTYYTVERNNIGNIYRNAVHDWQLRYSNVDADRHLFLATLSFSADNTPRNYSLISAISSNNKRWNILSDNTDKSLSPILDLYWKVNFGKTQMVRANATGSFIHTDYDSKLDTNGDVFAYSAAGKTWSLKSEAMYENRLPHFTLATGIRYNQKYVDNEYSGDAEACTQMRVSDIQGFAQINGRLGRLSYLLGTGVSRQYYRQAGSHYDRVWLHPQLTLSMPIVSGIKISYHLNSTPRASSLQNMSNVSIMTNDMEYTEGNSDMTMQRRDDHTLTLSYESPRLYTQLLTLYRHCAHPMMQHIYRNDDNKFVTTFKEGKRINMLMVQSYTSYDILPKHLTASTTAEVLNIENVGVDYNHKMTSFNFSLSLNVYLGKWSVSAGAENGFHFMENEYECKNVFSDFLNVSYRHKKLNMSLFWQNILQSHSKTEDIEYHNQYAHKNISRWSSDFGNAVGIKLTWTISKGRKFKSPERDTNSLKDKDTGVAK